MWHDAYYLIPAAALAATVLWASRARQAALRVPNPQGLPGRGLPLLHAAFLAGGPGRVFDTALVRMHRAGHVVVSRSRLVTVTTDRPQDTVERAIVEAVGPSRSLGLDPLRLAVMRSPSVQAIGDELAGRGLLRNPVRLRRARTAHRSIWLALLLTAALTALAYPLASHDGSGDDGPALWIPPLLLVVGLLALLGTRPPKGRITPAGRRQLGLMDNGTPWRPRHGARNADAALLGAIALGGLAAVGAAEFADEELQQALLASAAADQTVRAAGWSAAGSPSASSSSSSGSSSSGCGSSPAVWCGSSSDSGPSDSGSGSSGSSCGGSSGCGGGSSSSSSCSSGSSGCGSSSSSSCGSSCGGGCGS
ncbi:TIGR04222 domain-containing membrane protein [Kitasatospora sp. NPDC004723]|uniref:TIGR04222 domain-containing membrane protein n=1 Tax=Kitasatospora sp. NPDC004723 TaxID=3154288 RepID=UPI0033B7FA82